jgi:GPH family glycoside/pentoside/hexuronide:cation symporter
MSQSEFVRKYTRKDKIIWGFANFGTSIISGVYGTTLVFFYYEFLGLDPFFIAVSAWLYAIWNALNDPIFGYLSDKTRSKKGRRIPYMKFTAPFLGLTFVVLWFVPLTFDQLSIFIWMLVLMLLYDTAYTIIGLVYSALLPELSEDDAVRGSFQKSSSLFYLLGTILGFFLPDLVLPALGSTNLTLFYVSMILVAIIGVFFIMMTSFRFKERLEFVHVDKPLKLWPAIKYTFKSKSFLILTAANFMSIFFQQMILSYMIFTARHVLHMNVIFPLIALFLGLVLGVFLATILAKKLGVVQANQLFLIIGGISLIISTFLPDIVLFPCLFLAGIGLSGPLVLTNILFAQVADEDETKTGVRREAAFFGTNAMITKPAQSVAIGIGPTLLALAGFISGQTAQVASAVFMIKSLIGLYPGIASLVGAFLLIWYPLKKSYLKQIQEKVLTMHSEKHAKLKDLQTK